MNGSVLRILDANLNRAREALRVLEDYARFALDDSRSCAALKQLRHELADATGSIVKDAILHRDTPRDVGTDIRTHAEQSRESASHVVVAAGKRLGESLRVVEEYLKTLDPVAASRVERARYTFYDLERSLAITLRAPASGFGHVRLYVLISESACRQDWLTTARLAIEGGADCLQLREKSLSDSELLARARALVDLCRTSNVISIINDRPDIAVLAQAHGVHLGQDDLPAVEARKILGSDRIIGVSTHNIEQARQALLHGADYIGVGPVFPSTTKPRPILPGLEYARQAVRELGEKIHTVAIAGIDAENVDEVLKAGVRAIAVTAAVTRASDPRQAARRLKERLQQDMDV
jgi:thiamine-phosphate pyrophosphorylase